MNKLLISNNVDDDWINVHEKRTHIYNVRCAECKRNIEITQTGLKLTPDVLERIINEAHRVDSFDSYYRFYAEQEVQINVDLKLNNSIKNDRPQQGTNHHHR
jgi:hypothetical protein